MKWNVYVHYFKSIGWLLAVFIFTMNIISQVLSIGSSFWLNIWSNDNSTSILVNGTVNEYKRNIYLGVYGCFGLGQGIII